MKPTYDMWNKMTEMSLFNPKGLLEFLKKECNTEKIWSDSSENIHWECGEKEDTIHLFLRMRPRGVMIQNIHDRKASIVSMGLENVSDALHRTVYHRSEPIGVLRKEKEDIFCELLADSSVNIGDICEFKNEIICKGDELYGVNIESYISLYFAIYLTKECIKRDKSIHFTLWNESASSVSGLISAYQSTKCDCAILVSTAEEGENLPCGDGCGFVLKDGCFVQSPKMRDIFDKAASSLAGVHGYVGQTDSCMEKLSIAKKSRGVLGGYLPVAHRKTMLQKINLSDIEKTGNFLLKILDYL